jgi:hypothetical protein
MLEAKYLSRKEVERHSVDMRQFIDFRQSVLPNGMRLIEAFNSSGLSFTLLPDRGLDIWAASYKGIPLTWISQGSPHPPDFGQSWLRQFNGGLLTTCGLTHVGPPEHDDITGEQRDLHGLMSRLRATDISTDRHWYGDEDYSVWLNATISESSMFGEQLLLKRSYGLELGQPTITIWDTITNVGDKPSPLMLLYHFNIGYPLVREGTHLHTPFAEVYARDAAAQQGHDRWWAYGGASAGYAEQVFFHHLKGKQNGLTRIMLGNQTLAISLDWDLSGLGYFTQWKNTRQGIYVSGIEPGNCIPEGLNAARRNRRLQMLEPGQEFRSSVSLRVLEDKQALRECWSSINQLQDMGVAAENCRLADFAKVKV